jgi:C-terminal processing protease CtpA/Prc
MPSIRKSLWIRCFAGLISVAALGAAPVAAQPRNCGVTGQNLYVRDVLHELYYWYQFLPNLNPVGFASPEAYLEAVRYRPLDETFSYITSRAASEAFYSDSQYVGFGLASQSRATADDGDVEMRVAQVFPDSPASEIGLQRGDRVLAIGGRPVSDWWRSGDLGQAFGPEDIGYTTTVLYRHGDGDAVEASMTKRLVTIPTVSATAIYEVDGVKVGYVFFRNFVQPSTDALNQAFSGLKDAGVRELVLDLRYNGGGLVAVAQHLASLIGGVRTNGQMFAEYSHSDKNAFLNRVLRFEEKEHALTLDRVVVITTRGSASASELVINGLRPFVPVILIGDSTYGKPVGQYGIDFCEKTAYPVAFTMRNANGQGDFFGGIPVTCAAADDLDRQLADPAEGSLAEALYFVANGACSAPAATAARVQRRSPIVGRETGFRQLVGAW